MESVSGGENPFHQLQYAALSMVRLLKRALGW